MNKNLKLLKVKLVRITFAYFSKFFIKLMNIYAKSQVKKS